jgi:hypothetical protein
VRDARSGTRTIESTTTWNFAFLAVHDAALADVAALAERYFADDPVTSLMKVRQLGELLAQQVAARAGVLGNAEEPQAEVFQLPIRGLLVDNVLRYPSSQCRYVAVANARFRLPAP